MLGGQPNHSWQLCFPLKLHASVLDFRLYDSSDLKTYLQIRWLRPYVLAVVRPMDFFCSDIQFYVLLSPYLFFYSFLYLDLYVLGDNSWISKGSFVQTKHLCVLIHI